MRFQLNKLRIEEASQQKKTNEAFTGLAKAVLWGQSPEVLDQSRQHLQAQVECPRSSTTVYS